MEICTAIIIWRCSLDRNMRYRRVFSDCDAKKTKFVKTNHLFENYVMLYKRKSALYM